MAGSGKEETTWTEDSGDMDSMTRRHPFQKKSSWVNRRDVSVSDSSDDGNYTEGLVEFLETDGTKTVIWFDVLPDSRMLLLNVDLETEHSGSSLLSLYSSSKQLLSKLAMPETVSADTISDSQVAVPVRSGQYIQIVNIANEKLALANTIKARMKPFLIVKYSESSVLAATAQVSGRVCFQIINLNGCIERHIFVGTELEVPVFMKVSNNGQVIYVVDCYNGCYGFNLDGDQVFSYTHEDSKGYFGLVLDEMDSIHFTIHMSRKEYDILLKLAPDGEILDETEVLYMYPLKHKDDRLYLTAWNEGGVSYIKI